MPLSNYHHMEAKGRCNTSALVRTIDPKEQNYDLLGEKPECSSVFASFEMKHVTVSNGCLEDVVSVNMVRMNEGQPRKRLIPKMLKCKSARA